MSNVSVAPAHEIVIVPEGQKALQEECYDVRIKVFHLEQGFPLDTEIDEYEESSTHFLLRLVPSLIPIGTVRAYRPNNASYYKLSRLAVLKDYRRYKFGRDLVFALHDWVKLDSKRVGGAKVVIHSQIPAKGFYAKYGYEPEGEEFDEEGALHQKMVLRLPLDL